MAEKRKKIHEFDLQIKKLERQLVKYRRLHSDYYDELVTAKRALDEFLNFENFIQQGDFNYYQALRCIDDKIGEGNLKG